MTKYSSTEDDRNLFNEIYVKIRQGDYENALTLISYDGARLRSPYRLNPNHSWYIVGDIFFKLQRYTEAINAFRKSLRAREDDGEALWALGNCYSEIKKPRLAERYFRKALVYSKENDELIYNLGNALFDQEKYEDAVRYYLKVGKQNENLWVMAQKNLEIAKKRK